MPAMDGGAIAGRFLRTKVLKSGLGVTTHVGVDLEQGDKVIIKTVLVSQVSDAARVRLEHEATVLTRLEGLGSRALVAMGQDGDHVFLVQPFIPGRSLRDRLRDGPLSVASALKVGADVLQALQVAHDAEVLHRDVKPANVIVDDRDPIERAVLVDFGFARSAWLDADIRDEPVGTARYLAPEAAGTLDTATDERSDLYAVGRPALRVPGRAAPVRRDRRRRGAAPAPQLAAAAPAVARLRRPPRRGRRHPTTAAQGSVRALPVGRRRPRRPPTRSPRPCRAASPTPRSSSASSDRRHALAEPAFVGRAEELAELAGYLGRAQAGKGGLVLLGAESGMGKSRMLDELAQQAGAERVDTARPGRRPGGPAPVPGPRRRGRRGARRRRGAAGPGRSPPAAASASGPARRRPPFPSSSDLLGPGGAADFGPEAYGELRTVDALSALLDAPGDARAARRWCCSTTASGPTG